jgi:two-component system, NtrC family, response regulator AtoC
MDYSILVIDDSNEMCISLCEILEEQGYKCQYTTDSSSVEYLISKNNFDLVISDIRMPVMGGIDLLKKIKIKDPSIDIIMITGYPTIDNAVKAMKYGATNFYVKPLLLDELRNEIDQLYKNHFQKKGSVETSKELIVTEDPGMVRVLNIAKKAAPTQAPILISGESGTGKERLADYIHQNSNRYAKPFVKINCAAITETLLESELLGHEKGSFTGAVEQKKGKFELADGGMIFLDEIGDMSIKIQAKILRVIQEKEFERVGGTKTIKVDVRILAATNKDLKELIIQGKFREDLYYRLSVITIHLPPLRERSGDVSVLLNHFIRHFNGVYDKNVTGFSDAAEKVLYRHNWPGNIRELRNCMERAIIFCEEDSVSTEDLPSQYLDYSNYSDNTDPNEIIDSFNREAIIQALDESHGAKQKAAEVLNINRRTLYNRMKKLGL